MKSSSFSASFVTLCLISLWIPVPAALAEGAEWASFRGPNGDGIYPGSGIFDAFEEVGLAEVWKVPLGSGYSGIAVAGGRVITQFAAGDQDVMAAFDAASGKELWRYPFSKTYKGHDGSHDGPISTPLIADGRVFGIGPWGEFFALDVETGKEVWKTHLTEDQGAKKPHYGFGTSPILVNGWVVVELGGEDNAVGGFDPATGERKWVTGSDSVEYQTPTTWKLGDREHVVAVGGKNVLGLDASSGKLLWQYAHGGVGGRGAQSLTPVPAGENRLFLAHHNDSSVMVTVQPGEEGATVEPLWEGRTIRNSFNIAVYHQDHLFTYSSRFLTAVDAATGEARWRSRQPGDGFLTLVDGKLVILTKTGSVHVAEASTESYQELAGLQVFDDIAWTAPSFVDGSVFVRSMGELARVDLRTAKANEEVRLAENLDSPFGRFLDAVNQAESDGKNALVDKFFASQKTFPVVEENRAHFVYRGPAQDMALAGDMFGARREEPMTRLEGTDVFYYTLDLEPDARLNYVFLEDFQIIPDPLNDRRTGSALVGDDMEMSMSGAILPMSWMSMPGWNTAAHLEPAPEERRGRLETHELKSEATEDRPIQLQVYLPHGYDDSGETRYPVAFIHGGSSAAERGDVPNSLDNLIGQSVEPVIVAFFDIPVFGPQYSAVFNETVVSFVDENYPTRKEAAGRANVGQGMLGGVALIHTLSQGDQFAKVGVQSPFMFSQIEQMVLGIVGQKPENPPSIYLDWGKYDLRNPHEAWDMSEVCRRFAGTLESSGIAFTGGEVHDGSDWASWQQRTDRLFETLFPLESGS